MRWIYLSVAIISYAWAKRETVQKRVQPTSPGIIDLHVCIFKAVNCAVMLLKAGRDGCILITRLLLGYSCLFWQPHFFIWYFLSTVCVLHQYLIHIIHEVEHYYNTMASLITCTINLNNCPQASSTSEFHCSFSLGSIANRNIWLTIWKRNCFNNNVTMTVVLTLLWFTVIIDP